MGDLSKTEDKEITKLYSNPMVASALTMNKINPVGTDTSTLVEVLSNNVEKIANGDISEIEKILITQGQVLNSLFHSMLSKMLNTNHVNQVQVLADIALKAQKQSCKTFEILVNLKNPTGSVFIKNQNNAVNQQINNPS